MDDNIFSEIEIVTLPKFRIARYVVISPSPEEDAREHMKKWAKKSGLLDMPGYTLRAIGWDFPYVDKTQAQQFGLRGYVYAYVIPEDFNPACAGAEITYIQDGRFARLTITNPFINPMERIPEGFKRLHAFADTDAYRLENWGERYLFEEVFSKDGVQYMHLFYPVKEKEEERES